MGIRFTKHRPQPFHKVFWRGSLKFDKKERKRKKKTSLTESFWCGIIKLEGFRAKTHGKNVVEATYIWLLIGTSLKLWVGLCFKVAPKNVSRICQWIVWGSHLIRKKYSDILFYYGKKLKDTEIFYARWILYFIGEPKRKKNRT